MSDEYGFFSDTKKELESYLSNRLLLFKMQAANKFARTIAKIIVVMLLILFFFACLLFLSITAGYFFSTLTGSFTYGFGIVTGVYLIFFLFMLVYRKKMDKSIANLIIKTLLKKDE